MSYVFIRSEPNLYTVGFYSPDGEWHPESDYPTSSQAAIRVHYLNGGKDSYPRGKSEGYHGLEIKNYACPDKEET